LLGDREPGRHETGAYLVYVQFLTDVRRAIGLDQAPQVALVRRQHTQRAALLHAIGCEEISSLPHAARS
jgi:hypothetical protein